MLSKNICPLIPGEAYMGPNVGIIGGGLPEEVCPPDLAEEI